MRVFCCNVRLGLWAEKSCRNASTVTQTINTLVLMSLFGENSTLATQKLN